MWYDRCARKRAGAERLEMSDGGGIYTAVALGEEEEEEEGRLDWRRKGEEGGRSEVSPPGGEFVLRVLRTRTSRNPSGLYVLGLLLPCQRQTAGPVCFLARTTRPLNSEGCFLDTPTTTSSSLFYFHKFETFFLYYFYHTELLGNYVF
jgi:hypothetical protein